MSIAFVVIFLVADWLIHISAANYESGMIDYRVTTYICLLTQLLLIVPIIWYLGWIAGILFAAFSFFQGMYITIGWAFSLPSFFLGSPYRWAYYELVALIPAQIIIVVFTIVSFFVTKFGCLYTFISKNTIVLLPVLAAMAIGFAVRKVLMDRL